MSEDPVVPSKTPAVLKLEPGEYWWCSCGRSAEQPFCDGSHKGTRFSPEKDYRNSQHCPVQLQAFLARRPLRRVAFKTLNSALTRRDNSSLQSDPAEGSCWFSPWGVRSNLVVQVRYVCRLGRLECGSQAGLRTVPCDCLVAFP